MGRGRSSLALVLLLGIGSLSVVLSVSRPGEQAARPSLHVTVEAVVAVIAVLAFFLAVLRAYDTRRLDDYLLAAALGLLGGSHALFSTVPATLDSRSYAWLWSASTGRLAGALLLAAAALAPQTKIQRERSTALGLAIGIGIVLAAIGGAFALARSSLPATITPAGELEGRNAVYAVHGATLAAFAVAAAAFTWRWRHGGGILAGSLANAAALGALSRIDYLLDPSTGLSSVRPTDIVRVLFYIVIVLGLERDTASRRAETAAHDERRRIARGLHDGLLQELAYIARRAHELHDGGELAAAADRALAESRRTIAALRRPETEPLDVTLAAALDGLAARVGARLVLDLSPVSGVNSSEREALVAIAHEAVANAARHASADVVRVELANEAGVRMRVYDDGVGFEPAEIRPNSYGIEGMRERAEEIGARLSVSSQPGKGTKVEVVLG